MGFKRSDKKICYDVKLEDGTIGRIWNPEPLDQFIGKTVHVTAKINGSFELRQGILIKILKTDGKEGINNDEH